MMKVKSHEINLSGLLLKTILHSHIQQLLCASTTLSKDSPMYKGAQRTESSQQEWGSEYKTNMDPRLWCPNIVLRYLLNLLTLIRIVFFPLKVLLLRELCIVALNCLQRKTLHKNLLHVQSVEILVLNTISVTSFSAKQIRIILNIYHRLCKFVFSVLTTHPPTNHAEQSRCGGS